MKRIFSQIKTRIDAIESHPLFRDVHTLEDEQIPSMMKVWAPMFIHLSMTFRDVNRMFYAYLQPRDAYEREITAHADVDATHWRFLLDDLKTIGNDDDPCFYEEHLKQIWSDAGAPIRRYMYALVVRAQSCGESPYLRVASMESGEATVKLFFATTRLMAGRFKQVTGQTLKYFGEDHIRSEIDHAVDTPLFEKITIDDTTATTALTLVDAHFDKFKEFLDAKYFITFGKETA